MVDLSNLKAGDTVHFRCGGKAEILTVRIKEPERSYKYGVILKNSTNEGIRYDVLDPVGFYQIGGTLRGTNVEDPLDIIRVEPAFRWEDVKPGMAFVMTNKKLSEEVWFYLCPTTQPKIFLATTDRALGAYGAIEGTFSSWGIHDVIPAPEHDIEVAKQ